MNIESNYNKSMNVILIVAFLCFFNLNISLGQESEAISDFYEYANREWLDSTAIPQDYNVINNWGILWDEIIDKSIEILSGETNDSLEENYQYILNQLRNFYKSTATYSDSERKRVYLVQKYYPMLFGVVFSKITIPSEKEEKIEETIKYVRLAYGNKIKNSNKIGEKTRTLFLTILDELHFEIGAPDISSIPEMPILSADSLELNIQKSEDYQMRIKPIKPYWESPPFETDCRYNVNDNSVKLFAGTLYAVNFNDEEDFPMIFATLGRTIAHEMTHAFDTYGKKFNKKDWDDITNALINQFNQYSVQEKYFVDGKKTLQENFADLGGLEVSLLAMKLYITDNFPNYSLEEKSIAIRSYFIAYAQFWREKVTSEFEISSLERIHTPQKFRAIGPIYNQNELYEVYEIDSNSKYYISENSRIHIW